MYVLPIVLKGFQLTHKYGTADSAKHVPGKFQICSVMRRHHPASSSSYLRILCPKTTYLSRILEGGHILAQCFCGNDQTLLSF